MEPISSTGALSKLWELVSKHDLASFLKPSRIEREGMAQIKVDRAKNLISAQTEKDVEEIRSGRKNPEDFSLDYKFKKEKIAPLAVWNRIEPYIGLPSVVEAAKEQHQNKIIREQLNIASAIRFAEASLLNETQEPAVEPVDDDWLNRWRNYAGEVSSEKLQSLWGQALAGEVKSPGSFSLRTLDFIRNLSQKEAKLIEKMASFVIDNSIWRPNNALALNSSYSGPELSFKELMELQGLGVISGAEGFGYQTKWPSTAPDKFICAAVANNKVIIVKNDNPSMIVEIPILLLTSIGKEIMLLGNFKTNEDYLKGLGRHLILQGYSVILADFVSKGPDNSINVRNQVLIEDNKND